MYIFILFYLLFDIYKYHKHFTPIFIDIGVLRYFLKNSLKIALSMLIFFEGQEKNQSKSPTTEDIPMMGLTLIHRISMKKIL